MKMIKSKAKQTNSTAIDCVASRINVTTEKAGISTNDCDYSISPAKNEDGISKNLITFTLITSQNTKLSKRYFLDAGIIQKQSAVEMTKGKAQRLTMPFANFQNILLNANTEQAAVFGTHGFEHVDDVIIAVAAKASPENGVLARTKEYYQYPKSGGVLMLDHDPSKYGQTLTSDELISMLEAIHPAIAQAARIVRGSVSAGVHLVGEQPSSGKGFHVYIPVTNAADIPRYGKVLFDRLWLGGEGYIALATNGAKLLRTTIDAAVFSPERLDFISPPIIVGDGLIYTPPGIDYHEGNSLDTSTLLDLSDDELIKLKILQKQAKQAIDTQAMIVLGHWKEKAINAHVAGGASHQHATAIIENIVNSGFKDLYSDYLLEFTTGTVSVEEVLNNPQKYDAKALADPIEGIAYGKTTAKFYWNNGHSPCINSMAHGGCKYFLQKKNINEKTASQSSENLFPALHERPCYRCFDEEWEDDKGKINQSGVWLFTAPKSGLSDASPLLFHAWICGVIKVTAIARDKNNRSFGSLLKFQNKLNIWQTWNMPARLMAGRGDELLSELFDRGLAYNHKHRNDILIYINSCKPDKSMWSTDRLGWMDESFVLPGQVFGNNAGDVMFNSENNHHNEFDTAGTLINWRDNVAALCVGNAGLMFTCSTAFVGALLQPCNVDSFGVHWFGESSKGKTTGLKMAASVWGKWKTYKRTWKSTANGLEGAALLFNDGLLTLDEINDGDPKEISKAIYTIFNGTGKQRATMQGHAKNVANWNVAVLSNGESDIETFLGKYGIAVQPGQLVRFLQIPIWGRYGAFDELHGSSSGWEFSNRVTKNAELLHGEAGRAYLEKLTVSDLNLLPEKLHIALEGFTRKYGQLSDQENRAAKSFALVGVAGELATDYGITGWNSGDAMQSALLCFDQWRDHRGVGDIEPQRVKNAVQAYVETFGDARFTSTNDGILLHGMRSGYWRNDNVGRIWLFTEPGLKEATPGLDLKSVINVLQREGWLITDSDGNHKVRARIKAKDNVGTRFYSIRIVDK